MKVYTRGGAAGTRGGDAVRPHPPPAVRAGAGPRGPAGAGGGLGATRAGAEPGALVGGRGAPALGAPGALPRPTSLLRCGAARVALGRQRVSRPVDGLGP